MSHTNHETRRKRRDDARFVRSMAKSVLYWQENARVWERLGRPDNAEWSYGRAARIAENAMVYCMENH